MSAWAIVVAAGAGERLGDADGLPKAFRMLGGRSMFMRCVDAIQQVEQIEGVVVLFPENWMGTAAEHAGAHGGRLVIDLRAGGRTRQETVALGLAVVPPDVEAVVVHDAARPFATPELFVRALEGLTRADAAICAVPVTDTLKRVEGDRISGTVDRDGLWRAQTPQAFRAPVLRRAHEEAARSARQATDDAALVEQVGGTCIVVPGDEANIKITTQRDLTLAEAMAR